MKISKPSMNSHFRAFQLRRQKMIDIFAKLGARTDYKSCMNMQIENSDDKTRNDKKTKVTFKLSQILIMVVNFKQQFNKTSK